MAADNDIDIKIKLSADKRGGDEVAQTMDRVELQKGYRIDLMTTV